MRLGDRLGGTPPGYENPPYARTPTYMDPWIHTPRGHRLPSPCAQPLPAVTGPSTPYTDPRGRPSTQDTRRHRCSFHGPYMGAEAAPRGTRSLDTRDHPALGLQHVPRLGPQARAPAHWAGPGLAAPGVGPSWAMVWPWQGPCPLGLPTLLGKNGCQGSCVPLPSFPGPETRPGLGLGSRPPPAPPQ
ncbi:hypothetical protein mRhiFer1_010212 [Rhinolophus ferrumequinum]|uniref:Uncharacterized protein n=1 Tax=Rhinolophus ferrumequinum TaxID=59479 RepID=A0A7J7X593_RHIFE|nr:hypothetical protein mRhiFer1_010212 [Rhinolophus ferrumequinum]